MISLRRARIAAAFTTVLTGMSWAEAAPDATPRAMQVAPTWLAADYSLTSDARAQGPRILLIYDMEGLSGQDDIKTSESEYPEAYQRGRRLLTDDVNAVVAGLYQGGARSVEIIDGHGGGNRQIDVIIPEVDPRASVIQRVPVDAYADLASAGTYDALVAVGMHAKARSRGFWAHTYTWGIDIAINGSSLSEAELLALAYGHAGIPLIFVSGDDVLGESLKPMTWLQYVTVKRSTGPASAALLPLAPVHAALSDGARKAVAHLAHAKLVKPPITMEVTVRAIRPWDGSWLRNLPGVRYVDNGIVFAAADFPSAYRGIKAASSAVVIMTYYDAIERGVSALPNHTEIELRLADEYNRLWLEGEQAKSND